MKQKDAGAKKSVWICPVCRNEESINKRPDKCHICGTPGERLTTEVPHNDNNKQEL